jgi:hypothetical protein
MGKKARNRNRQARRPDGPLLIGWHGETYQVADKVGDMPMILFGNLAAKGVDSDSPQGLAAMHDVLAECLTPKDWQRFQAHAIRIKAQSDEIMGMVGSTFEALSGRPTVQPSVSSDGLSDTPESSEAGSSSPVTRVLDSIPEGRPDLKLAVWEAAQEQQAV